MDAKRQYQSLRAAGLSKDEARRLTMRDAWQDEVQGLQDGLNAYSDDEVKMATVHFRQDMSVLCSDIGELLKEQRRSRFRANFMIALLALLTLVIAVKQF